MKIKFFLPLIEKIAPNGEKKTRTSPYFFHFPYYHIEKEHHSNTKIHDEKNLQINFTKNVHKN